MSNKIEAPAVHIAPEHQSSPKQTDADKAIKIAAEEIATGKFVPDFAEANEFFDYGPTQFLAQHPAVQDALRRLENEKREAKNPQEALEKAQQLYELNVMASAPSMWDGQQRWMGKDAEDMRIGQILSPQQFMEKLAKVIGVLRVQLNRFAVNKRVALLAPSNEARPLIILPGVPEARADDKVQVGTLQWPCGSEWMVMRFDDYGVPTTPKYLGWRTALLTMIQLGVITEREAHKAFPLGSGPAGDWYREQLQMLRNQGRTVN